MPLVLAPTLMQTSLRVILAGCSASDGLVLVDKKLRDLERTSKGAAAASKRVAEDVAAGDLGSELGKDAATFLPRLYEAACPGLVPVVKKQMQSAGL